MHGFALRLSRSKMGQLFKAFRGASWSKRVEAARIMRETTALLVADRLTEAIAGRVNVIDLSFQMEEESTVNVIGAAVSRRLWR